MQYIFAGNATRTEHAKLRNVENTTYSDEHGHLPVQLDESVQLHNRRVSKTDSAGNRTVPLHRGHGQSGSGLESGQLDCQFPQKEHILL